MALTDNLLAFYKLSDLTDSSGNNRTLTNNGNVSFASGKIGNAAVFDGSNYLSGPVGLGSGSEQLTVSFWCNLNNISSGHGVNNEGSGEYNWGFYLDGSHRFYLYNQNSENINITTSVEQNTDILYTATYDGQVVKLYKNGTLADSASITGLIKTSTNNLFIGGYGGNGGIDGQIDAVGIWNRALSEQEVAALYNSGTGLELDGGNGGGGGGNPTLVKMEAPIKFFGKVKFGV
jgi:hypothetical protein